MNLRQQITNKLLELLFDGRHEYIPDCEDAALEILKLIAADSELVSTMRAAIEYDDVEATVNELRDLAAQYNDLMEERERAENGEGERSVERIDETIDELLGETMAVTGRLLTPETTPPESKPEPMSLLDMEISKWLNSGATNAQISRHICEYVSEQWSSPVSPETRPAHIIVVYDKETDHEAIYVDGLLFDSDLTMYASDMVRAIGERTVVNVSSVDVLLTPREAHWPKRFDDLMKFVIDTENDDQ